MVKVLSTPQVIKPLSSEFKFPNFKLFITNVHVFIRIYLMLYSKRLINSKLIYILNEVYTTGVK
jgi:hypothetical protein